MKIQKPKNDPETTMQALGALGGEPEKPLEPMLIVTEPTFEGLCKLFAEGQPSLGLFAAEGGSFIGGHGMSDESKLRTSTGLSNLWDGEPIRRVRGGDGVQMLPGRRLSAHLMCQPDVSNILLNDSLLAGQGILSRFLMTAPQPAAGKRHWKESSAKSNETLEQYNKRFFNILNTDLPLEAGKRNELNPRHIELSLAARKLWIIFADEMESAMAEGGELASVKNLANKLPEHAARMAAVLTLMDNLKAATIETEKMAAGITLAKHYAHEARRIVGASRINADLHLAQKVLTWLQISWKEPLVSLPDIYQRGPVLAIRDKKKAQEIVSILVDHGYLINEGKGIIAGVKRQEVWRIIPVSAT